MRPLHPFLLSFTLAGFCAGTTLAGQPPAYRFTDLGSLGASESQAAALNSHGEVVGWTLDVVPIPGPGLGDPWFREEWRIFRYRNGAMQTLGSGQAFDINDSGWITGHRGGLSGQAFIYRDNRFENLGAALGSQYSTGFGINDRGEVTGWAQYEVPGPNGFSNAFLYADGRARDVRGFDRGEAINDRGQIAANRNQQAFLYSNGVLKALGDLSPDPNPDWAGALDVNDRGQVVGYAGTGQFGQFGYTYHAFLYSDGRMQDLGTLGGQSSEATAVNNAGHIVGQAGNVAGDTGGVPFLYRDGRMYELGTLLTDRAGGVELLFATDINDAGQIVGTALVNGETRAYLLTPVPEPAIYRTLLLGLAVLGLSVLRRRLGTARAPEAAGSGGVMR